MWRWRWRWMLWKSIFSDVLIIWRLKLMMTVEGMMEVEMEMEIEVEMAMEVGFLLASLVMVSLKLKQVIGEKV